jgi:uncharacterized membrane protein YbhN (UPF0104 family)
VEDRGDPAATPPVATPPGPRRGATALRVALGVVLFAGLLAWLTPDLAALHARARIDLRWAAIGLTGTTLASLVTAARWKLITEAMGGTRLPFAIYLHALVMTRFVGQFVPMLAVDLVGRGMALRSRGSERGLGHAVAQALVERLLDAVLPAVILIWAFATPGFDHPAAWRGLAVFAAGFVVVSTPLLAPVARMALHVLAWLRTRMGRPSEPEPLAVAPFTALQAALLGLLRYAAVVVQFTGWAAAAGVLVAAAPMTAATAVAQLAGLIGITPGALGIQEAGWTGALHATHAAGALDGAAIALFLLATRVGSIAGFGVLTLLTRPLAAAVTSAPPSASR